MVAGKTPADMPDVLHETFSKTIEEARSNPPELTGSGYYTLMELGEFVPSRVVEAVVHGMDLTNALGRETIATPPLSGGGPKPHRKAADTRETTAQTTDPDGR